MAAMTRMQTKKKNFKTIRGNGHSDENCKENNLVLRSFIDPMHKWRQFKYFFVYIQISPTSLILGKIFF